MRLFAAVVCLLLAASRLPAEPVEEKRLVIALIDTAGLKLEYDVDDPVHQVLETPLNYLGMVVRRHDIRSGPPPRAWLPRARAVLTYFQEAKACPDWLWPWLQREVRPRGLRFVAFGDWGPLARDGEGRYDPSRLAAWLEPCGLRYDDSYVQGPLGVGIRFRDRRLCASEADPTAVANHVGPVGLSDANRIWVTTWPIGEPDRKAHPVVTGPWGAVALDPWTLRMGAGNENRRWYLDPFVFFEEALGLTGVPAPHPQVLNGRRMFFLHLDGDGFESQSTIQPGRNCAEVFETEVLDRYALPYTLSIIVASLTKDYAVAEPTREMLAARRILNRPEVEVASHGVLHPLRWDTLPGPKTLLHTITWYPGLENYDYSQVNEVRESIRFINERLMEGDKRCAVMLWTGSAIPPEEAIHASDALGCENINGGIFRWDRWYDSVGFVAPWARLAGDAIQVHPGAANENVFEGYYETMPGAFAHIDTTIERTGSPRILKPANVYIHFYSAERPMRLKALRGLIERWAFREPTAVVHASTYARAVRSAILGARIYRTPEGWSFRDFGDCPTVRLEHETRAIDLAHSRGLIGYRRVGDTLFLHLGDPDAEVVFGAGAKRRPHVEEANHLLADVRLSPNGIDLVSGAHSRREIVLAGFPPGAEVAVALDDSRHLDRADAEGRVALLLPEPGRTTVRVRVRSPASAR